MGSESLIFHFLFLSLKVTTFKRVFYSFQNKFIDTQQQIYYASQNLRCFSASPFLVFLKCQWAFPLKHYSCCYLAGNGCDIYQIKKDILETGEQFKCSNRIQCVPEAQISIASFPGMSHIAQTVLHRLTVSPIRGGPKCPSHLICGPVLKRYKAREVKEKLRFMHCMHPPAFVFYNYMFLNILLRIVLVQPSTTKCGHGGF